MNKGVKFRIYPNKEQQNLINQTLGCCRLVYNIGLEMRNKAFENGEKVNYSKTCAMLTEIKRNDEFSFFRDADSVALQQSLRDLDQGFVNFFEKRARHPRFKSKHGRQSYRTMNPRNNIRIVGKCIRLPKLGYIKVRQSMEVGKINNATVIRTPSGKYFVVLNVDFEPESKQNDGGSIGIDVGIKEFYSDSNGDVVSNPKFLEKSSKKLRREQRKLSKKQKGSNNSNKQRIRVAKVHEKVTNQRNDFLQKISSMLISENQVICVEDLKIKNMVRNRKLARCISSISWGKFFNMLEYKANWYGNEIIKVPTMYPSSQTCSCCGYKNPLVKNLAVRKWECQPISLFHEISYE